MQLEALVYNQSALFNGPYGISSRLLRAIGAAPFEGLWVPVGAAKVGSIEVNGTGTISNLALSIFGTNSPDWPQNSYTLTIGGSITTGDTLTATFTNPNLPNGSRAVAYTMIGGDTLTTAAAKLAALIQSDAQLAPLGFTATSLVGVITVQYPSLAPGIAAGGSQNPPLGNFTGLAGAVGGSATETFAVGLGTDGYDFSDITAIGYTSFPMPVNFIKARLTALAGGGTVSASYHGAA